MDLDGFLQFWRSFAGNIISALPQSPTVDSEALETIALYAGYINYVFPVGKFLLYVSAILSASAGFYLQKIILRILKVIK